MALTGAQKLQAKKHMGVWPHDDILDASIAALEDGSVKESELTAAIALCETTQAAIKTAQSGSDELVEGGGAKFSYERYISIRRRAYRDAQLDLARILSVDLESSDASMSGWRVF